ncbi:MAG: hypothetical protein NT179_01460 [Nitrospirae bacterium]|nr:hypothetical protein [Nitrospirota bacterium]
MSTTKDFHPELLRPLGQGCEPDPRNTSFVTPDHETGNFIPLDLRNQHEAVSKHTLHAKVPEDIMMQFETARNLYLYAWFVYRFYPVCEHHALVCLELALRERYEHEAPNEYRNRDGKLYLKRALRYAIDHGHVKHEGFRRWREAAQRRALLRYQTEKTDEMYAKGLKEIDLDYSEATVTDADRNLEYLNFLASYLPEIRNHYAHGTSMLHNQVLTTLEVASEIINQIYPAK